MSSFFPAVNDGWHVEALVLYALRLAAGLPVVTSMEWNRGHSQKWRNRVLVAQNDIPGCNRYYFF
jgi:hypothetical protein